MMKTLDDDFELIEISPEQLSLKERLEILFSKLESSRTFQRNCCSQRCIKGFELCFERVKEMYNDYVNGIELGTDSSDIEKRA